jgi:serine/threonine-protein kinase
MALPPANDLVPASLADRFRISRTLGAGGFGQVFLARDTRLDREVALKVLAADATDPLLRKRFTREAQVTARLRHSHVVEVFDHGIDEGVPWIAYEVIRGGSLLDHVEASGRPTQGRLSSWIRQAAEALQVAHDAGVIHRDVKPENLLLREDGSLVLCDFGIARSNRQGTLISPGGLVLGTPPYMAPEVLMGDPPSAASDQFALAATVYYLAEGGWVYGSPKVAPILEAIRRGWSPPPLPAFPAIRRALAADPADRYPSLVDLAAALDSPPARPTTTASRVVDATPTLVASRPSEPARASPRRRLGGPSSVVSRWARCSWHPARLRILPGPLARRRRRSLRGHLRGKLWRPPWHRCGRATCPRGIAGGRVIGTTPPSTRTTSAPSSSSVNFEMSSEPQRPGTRAHRAAYAPTLSIASW